VLPTIFPLIVNLILEQNGKVLFIYRENTNTYNHLYALPAGKVEKGESLKQSIIREAKEEVGIDLHEDDLELVTTLWARYIYEALKVIW
jgi:ADP-ribose pyrophosphatase YjhB (NUDIX family)